MLMMTQTKTDRGLVLDTLGGDAAARRKLLMCSLARDAERYAGHACAAGAHRQHSAAARKRATEQTLGAAPKAVQQLVEGAHQRWAARQSTRSDKLADRCPGNVARRAVLRELARIYRAAGFRQATHSHRVDLRYGAPRAESNTAKLWGSDVGLPNSYRHPVVHSDHELQTDASVFRVPRDERVGDGWVQLSPGVRVIQSRGTALHVDRQVK